MLNNINVILGPDVPLERAADSFVGTAAYNDETHQLVIDVVDERTRFVFEKGLDRSEPVHIAISVLGRASEEEVKAREDGTDQRTDLLPKDE